MTDRREWLLGCVAAAAAVGSAPVLAQAPPAGATRPAAPAKPATSASSAGRAPTAARSFKLGWLHLSAAPRTLAYDLAFIARLEELGFAEGRNLAFEFRSANGKTDRLPAAAAELAQQPCDVYLAFGSEVNLLAFKDAVGKAPIVLVASDYDPLVTGHVNNLARPGGNLTGISLLQADLPARRLDLLHELLPKVRRLAVLSDESSEGPLAMTRRLAAHSQLELLPHVFKQAPYNYEAAFDAFSQAKAEALLVLNASAFAAARSKIVALALQHKLPSVAGAAQWADAGAVASYGTNLSHAYRRAADQVAKILRGAKPGDIPLEQPNVAELVLNLKTARALGLKLPEAVRKRADRLVS